MSSTYEVLKAAPICFWDFSHGLTAQGKVPYKLEQSGISIPCINDGVFGQNCLEMAEGRFLKIPRSECSLLDFSSERSQLTMIAWIKRSDKRIHECQAIAGMWNETDSKRQYCLFLDLHIWESSNQVGGHISSTGGPTEGYRYCMDAAIGATPVSMNEWHMIGFAYDGKSASVYLDGKLDHRGTRNPYDYGHSLFMPGEDGADFTVGGVYRKGTMGNWFCGLLGGLAVYDYPLAEKDMLALA